MVGQASPGDALHDIDRATLAALLAAYYRDLGWWVARADDDAARSDGGTWVLKRDRDILLLDCRHWDRGQRPQDAVASLVDEIGRAGATGAILVDRRAFARADHDAANRHGHVRLIDAVALRVMLGDVPAQHGQLDPFAVPLPVPTLSRPRPRAMRPARKGAWAWWLVSLACLVLFVLLVRALLARTADTAVPPDAPVRAAVSPTQEAIPNAGEPVRKPRVEFDAVRVRAPRSSRDARAVDEDKRSEDAIRLIADDTPEL